MKSCCLRLFLVAGICLAIGCDLQFFTRLVINSSIGSGTLQEAQNSRREGSDYYIDKVVKKMEIDLRY
jgi:hypothetical protein